MAPSNSETPTKNGLRPEGDSANNDTTDTITTTIMTTGPSSASRSAGKTISFSIPAETHPRNSIRSIRLEDNDNENNTTPNDDPSADAANTNFEPSSSSSSSSSSDLEKSEVPYRPPPPLSPYPWVVQRYQRPLHLRLGSWCRRTFGSCFRPRDDRLDDVDVDAEKAGADRASKPSETNMV